MERGEFFVVFVAIGKELREMKGGTYFALESFSWSQLRSISKSLPELSSGTLNTNYTYSYPLLVVTSIISVFGVYLSDSIT